jgi:hypothetical protein
MKKAIVTLAIGDKYQKIFEAYCRKSWEIYSNKFDYDLIVIKESLDKSERASKRSPAWQKLLILSQEWSSEYNRIVWIDLDVVINNSRSYDICDSVPIELVGAVEAYSIPSKEIHDIALARNYEYYKKNNISYIDNMLPSQYYTNREILGQDLNEVMQTGVFVCSPKFHRDIFEYIYYNYEDNNLGDWNYEMPAMSYELVKSKLVHWISPSFNFVVSSYLSAYYPAFKFRKKFIDKVVNYFIGYENRYSKQLELNNLKNLYDLSIFMHFAGNLDKLSDIDTLV